MTRTVAEPPKRRPYKIRGAETWALIREAYLAGAPAKVLAARFDVTPHAIYARASRQHWPKHAAAAPVGPLPDFAAPGAAASRREPLVRVADGAEEPGDLARAALRGVGAALRQDRLDEAKGLAQLADVLSRVSLRGPSSTLETVVRALHDPDYRVELLGLWGEPNPDPAKRAYWAEESRRRAARAEADAERRRAAAAQETELARLRAIVARLAPDQAEPPVEAELVEHRRGRWPRGTSSAPSVRLPVRGDHSTLEERCQPGRPPTDGLRTQSGGDPAQQRFHHRHRSSA